MQGWRWHRSVGDKHTIVAQICSNLSPPKTKGSFYILPRKDAVTRTQARDVIVLPEIQGRSYGSQKVIEE
ncbi:MAG: hypothetical protein JKY51_06175 [Opitutaceae bacterium]|nr:hypothetical protein [Opitutaceae bacterium]